MAVGNGRPAFIANVAEDPQSPLAELFRGRSRERPVEGVQFGQGEDIGRRIAFGKGPGGRLVAAILKAAWDAEPGDQAGEMVVGKASHLAQVSPGQPRVGLFQMGIAQAFESTDDEGVSLHPIRDLKFEWLAAVQKGADLIQGGDA